MRSTAAGNIVATTEGRTVTAPCLPFPFAWRSRPGKHRLTAIEARSHAFLEVVRLAQDRLLEHLALGRCPKRGNEIEIERLAGGLHPERARFRDLRSHLLRNLPHLGLRHEAVREAYRIGFIARNALPRQEQPL